MIKNGFASAAQSQSATAHVTFNPLRSLFANPLLNRTRRKAAKRVQEFRSTLPVFYMQLDAQAQKPLQSLLEVKFASDELRKTAQEEAGKIKLPDPDKVQTVAALRKHINSINAGIQNVFKKSDGTHVFKSVRDHAILHAIKHRAKQNPAELAKLIPLVTLNFDLSNLPDRIGHTVGDSLTLGHEIMHDILPDGLADLTDSAVDFLLIPGALSLTKTVFKEFKMLANNETDWEEALTNGIGPALAKSGIIAAGALIDSCFGWMTFGAFTALAYLASGEVKSSNAREDLEYYVGQLKPYLNQIKDREQKGIDKISESVTENFKDFPDLIKKCPDFAQLKQIRGFADTLTDAYGRDTKAATAQVDTAFQKKIETLPQRNWIDKLCGIDRPAEIAKLYTEAGDSMVMQLEYKADDFNRAARKSPEELAAYLSKDYVLQDGCLCGTLTTLSEDLPGMAAMYALAVDVWKANCKSAWETGTDNIETTSKKENGAIERLTKKLDPEMNPIRTHIRANLNRLNRDPNLCP